MKVAVPWSLSHYIPLNGFHPLYRALFDHAPADVGIAAWDNVKLYRHFARDLRDRERVSNLAGSHKLQLGSMSAGIVARLHADYFYPPDRVLTEALPGEVEIHHTAPFPSLTRPFVLHCESFAPVFFPSAQQGIGKFGRHEELRLHYKGIFENPLCQGIYSHIPETLDSLSTFFSDPAIDAKLFRSRIGLSKLSVDPSMIRPRKRIDKPRFLFINSAHQMSSNFFNRGGHVVLKFWKEFRSAGRNGTLILRCARPADEALVSHGVDPAFITSELGRSILWAEGYLANHEINALIADAHFFLLPSASLHSASILSAMTLGAVPVVTDTRGTSVYVTDREDAVVLKGVRDAIWNFDPDTGVFVDHYSRMPSVTASLVSQMIERVFELLDSHDAYLALSRRTAARARKQFSGEKFAAEFWESIIDRAERSGETKRPSSKVSELEFSLQKCTLDAGDWARVFEGSTQPMRLLDTGTSTVAEFGGAVVHLIGRPSTNLTDWSVVAQYFSPSAPATIFANTLVDLGDVYLPSRHDEIIARVGKWGRRISRTLMRFPKIHSLTSRSYRTARKAMVFGRLWLRYMQYKSGGIGNESYTELVLEDVHNFNVIRCFHKYYAIPCGEGPFVFSRAEKKLYSTIFCAYSLEKTIVKVNRGKARYARRIANIPIVASVLHRVGEDRVRTMIRRLTRKQITRD